MKQAVIWALEAGYRHIDCASIYGNEAEIGEALQEKLGPEKVKLLHQTVQSSSKNAHKLCPWGQLILDLSDFTDQSGLLLSLKTKKTKN